MAKIKAVRLYDLRKRSTPKQQMFRTLQVHQCPTCEVRTNNAENCGFLGTCLSPVCPNILKDWHNILAELKRLLQEAKNDSVKSILQTEVDKVFQDHQNEIVDDIVGDADPSLTW